MMRRLAVVTMIVASAVMVPVGRPTPADAAFLQVTVVPLAPLVAPVPSARADLDCPTITTCYAADGAMSRTTDGGATWTRIDIPLQWSFTAVECWDALHCVAGIHGPRRTDDRVRWTADGGETWETRGTAPVRANALSCPTTLRCTAVEQGISGLASGYWVAHTTDNGGLTWTSNSTDNAMTDPKLQCTVSGLCVIADQNTLYRSTDFGDSWTQLDGSPPGDGLACPTVYQCVVSGVASERLITSTGVIASMHIQFAPSRASSCPTVTSCVHVSDDGGDVVVVRRELPVGETTPAGSSSLVAVDASVVALDCLGLTCTLLLQPTTAPLIGSGIAWVLRSLDGGETWTTVASGARPAAVPRAVACTGSHCVLGGSSGVASGGFLAHSADAGSTWQPVGLPPGAAPVQAVECSSVGLCVAARTGSPGGFSVSLDYGVGWTEVVEPQAVVDRPAITCAGSRCLAVVGTGSASRTLVWTTESTQPTVYPMMGISSPSVGCMTESSCLLSFLDSETKWPAVYKTTDGGATWVPVLNDGRVVGCWDAGCVVTASDYTTRVTRDLGSTFGPSLGTRDLPLDLGCQGNDCIMLTDGTQSVWTSTDGGDTWHGVQPETRLRAVNCVKTTCVGLTIDHVVRVELVDVDAPPIAINGPADALQPAVRLG